ncbi:MAG: DUF4198 domain-containing protein [Chromatiales bacterium]|nr:DUF4198 domain-containing protein [Chromatiales bacterium]
MRIPFSLILASSLLIGLPSVQAEMVWSKKPSSGKMGGMQHGGMSGQATNKGKKSGGAMNHRRGKTFYLSDSVGASIVMLKPNLEEKEITLKGKNGKLNVPSTGVDNYHALVATRVEDQLHESAIRYVYMRGKPSKVSPTKLVESDKFPLEIIPEPYVRGHRRYLSNDSIKLRVDFKGEPLANAWVGLSTSNGSKLEANTDSEGRVSFIFPDDFKNVRPGRSKNPAGEFILRTGISTEGMLYRTNLAAPYSTDPSHWESMNAGLFLMIGGIITGLLIMRREKPKKIVKKRKAA